ncbi:MAG: ABC-2 transporter permease [Acidobacteria bacterium]|nr:ABC-2 transporter permease [Acidobacteriota bacterium]
MTLNVIRYDILMNWKILALFLAFFLVLLAREPVGGTQGEFLAITALMGAIIPLVTVAREDRFHAREVLAASPLRRCDTVRARYLGGGVCITVLVTLVIVVQWVLYPERPQTLTMLAPANLALAASVGVLFLSATLPLVFRFGLAGMLIFMAVVQLLGTVLLFAAASGGSGRGALGNLAASVRGLRGRAGDPVFYLFLAVFLTLAAWGSCRLSSRILSRRDL